MTDRHPTIHQVAPHPKPRLVLAGQEKEPRPGDVVRCTRDHREHLLHLFFVDVQFEKNITNKKNLLSEVAVGLLCPSAPLPPETLEHKSAFKTLAHTLFDATHHESSTPLCVSPRRTLRKNEPLQRASPSPFKELLQRFSSESLFKEPLQASSESLFKDPLQYSS